MFFLFFLRGRGRGAETERERESVCVCVYTSVYIYITYNPDLSDLKLSRFRFEQRATFEAERTDRAAVGGGEQERAAPAEEKRAAVPGSSATNCCLGLVPRKAIALDNRENTDEKASNYSLKSSKQPIFFEVNLKKLDKNDFKNFGFSMNFDLY